MPELEQERSLIFISYTTADRERVLPFYTAIKSNEYDVWMDIHDIKGGQNWEFEISKAIDRAAIVISFISRNSVDRRGYIQKEVRMALDKFEEMPADDIFIIPVMLDDMKVPYAVKSFHALYANDEKCIEKLRDSIMTQLARLGKPATDAQESHNLSWSYLRYRDSWEWLPGYEASYQLVRMWSSDYPHVEELSHLIRRYLSRDLMAQRQVMFEQKSEWLNFGQSKYWRQNSYEATCTRVSIVGNVVSIEYTIRTFKAGAAHGYTYFKTFAFICHPTVYLENIEDIFVNPSEAIVVLQENIRRELLKIELNDDGMELVRLSEGSVIDGTSNFQDFSEFVFTDDGLMVLFAPYQVAAFAFGPQRATVKWRVLRPLVKQHILCALGRDFERFDEKDDADKRETPQLLQENGENPPTGPTGDAAPPKN